MVDYNDYYLSKYMDELDEWEEIKERAESILYDEIVPNIEETQISLNFLKELKKNLEYYYSETGDDEYEALLELAVEYIWELILDVDGENFDKIRNEIYKFMLEKVIKKKNLELILFMKQMNYKDIYYKTLDHFIWIIFDESTPLNVNILKNCLEKDKKEQESDQKL